MPDTIAADRAVERTRRIFEAIEEGEAAVAYALDAALDKLDYENVFPHTWASGAERNEACKRAAKLAMRDVLGAANLPDEVEAVYMQSGWQK